MDEQTFVPDTMRALYWSPASTALLDDTSLDEPRVDSEVVFDTNFPTPKPSPRQYLIKVQTAAFSLDELRVSKAKNPSKSIPQVPVHSFCGTIISTPTEDHEKPDGPKFKVDEAVFGLISYSADGAAADYVLATEDQIAHKPKNISAAEAATIPLPALTAWQALFKYAGLDPGKHNKETHGKLRILITNARPSEVGTQALHLLRSPDLFPHHPPWICATYASKDEEEMLRNEFKVDETILAPEPAPKDFDLTSIFRKNKWEPVDVVLDYTGEDILHQANNPAIVKDGGAVLTAVDANPVFNIVPKGKDGEGPSTKLVSVEPDGKTLGLISKMVEDNIVRGRVETVIDLVDGADFLSSDAPAAGGRSRAGIFVFRVNP
jgi:NADPH:quinone reductase-like Zn-dependent oxidoreductase